MKKLLLSTTFLLLTSGAAKAQDREFENVPVGSWPYAAVAQLIKAGEVNALEMPPDTLNRPKTRYEFAVILARWMENDRSKTFRKWEDRKTRDILCALGYEFAHEILSIRGRGPIEEIPLKSKISTTPSSDWFDVWRGALPLEGVERILPSPKRRPASFLRRRLNYEASFPFKPAHEEQEAIFLSNQVKLRYITPMASK